MAFDEDRRAETIAAEWGIEPDLLDEADWELEPIDSNDGFTIAYFVRFKEDTDRELLNRLGVRPGEFQREISMAAFNEPDDSFDHSRPRPRQQQSGRRAYYIDDRRFTPSQFKKLSDARKVEAMSQWFLARYQDPSNETSYNGREGGFLWTSGGPYDADDELQNEFQDLADFNVIQQAVENVQSDGIYEWAPIRGDYSDDDYDRDLRIREGEEDDGIYSINEPLPDISEFTDEDEEDQTDSFPPLPPGQTYLTDEKGQVLTDERGRGLVVDAPASSSAVGGASMNEYVVNGPAYAGAAFAGSSFVNPLQTGDVRAPVEALRVEMLNRLDQLESILRQNLSVAPNRGHNRPPELLEIEQPVTQEQFREVIASIQEIRRESESRTPNTIIVQAQVSKLRNAANALSIATIFVSGAAVEGIIGQEAGAAYTAHKQLLINALFVAADAVSSWVHALPSIF